MIVLSIRIYALGHEENSFGAKNLRPERKKARRVYAELA
jgi:hypothetical protein